MNQLKDVALSGSRQRLWSQVVELIIVAIVYWVAVRLGLLVVARPEGVASIWPASGLALAVLLLSPKNKWARLLAVIFVTNAAGNWIGGNSFIVNLGFALANTIEPFFGAWVLSYLCTAKISFNRTLEIFALFGVAILCNGITALLGAAVPALAFGSPFLLTWRLWWAADGLGIILMTPIIVTWATNRDVLTSLSPRRLIEAIVLVAMLATFAWLLFGPFTVAEKPLLRNYMVFPLLIWLAFRFNQRVMASALFLFATIAIWNTLQGWGVFGFAAQTVTEHLTSVQVLLIVTTFSGFLLNAMVSEHKQAMETLRESEEKNRIIFNNEIYAICIFDLETLRLLDVNEAYYHMYGYSREELISGMTYHDITAEQQASDAVIKQAIKEGTFFIPLRYHRKKDGTVFPVEIVGSPYTWKGQKVMFALAHDITDRMATEEVLKIQRWRLESIINGTRVGTWEWNVQTGETVFNEIWAQIIGYTLDELAPINLKTWVAFSHPDDLKLSTELLERHFAGELPYYHCECRMKHKDGHWVWVLDRGSVISRTDEGKPLWMFGTHTDITEQKQAEQNNSKLEAMNWQLQKSKSLGVMAGAIAHIFNNQLGVVMGNLEMALEDCPQDAATVKSLTAAMQGARKAAEVSGQMLTYLGQTTGIHTPLDLSESCRQSLPLIKATIPQNITLQADLPSPGPTISANANQIMQILTNLVTNAWEAVDKNQGTIGLTVKTISVADIAAAHRFPIDWQPQDVTYACLEVTDTGCGIVGEDIDEVFDPFFSTKFTGRGLGLPVVVGIVKAHNGAVTLESEMGRGSSFRVFFPVSKEEIAQLPGQTAQALAREGGGTVLLVDDLEILREVTTTMLTRLGYTVLAAKDGVEAVEIFTQHQDEIRCVLSDLTMPRMDGWQTLTALRRLSPGIPVILSSGYDEAQVLIGDHPERPQAFLHKPYQMVALQAALAKAMEKV